MSKTKIVATVGPACDSPELLRQMAVAGVDVFRLNFAHGQHDQMAAQVAAVRRIADQEGRPLAVLGDLGGPKIRLGALPDGSLQIEPGQTYAFVAQPDPNDPTALTTNYEGLIDDLQTGDPLLLADGTVALRVVEKMPGRVVCAVEQPGLLRSGQGVNLPGIELRVPTVTEKDRTDLAWAVAQGLDFVGLSFVRGASDISDLRQLIGELRPRPGPQIVAKIEKREAVANLESILAETDAVMVARGDLGVEVDIVRVPAIQKQIIRACNRRRVPVITATQMLDSMQHNTLPTRAEASDVANAVLDGSDAVMLSGETAIGKYPLRSVSMMSRIVREAEPFVVSSRELPIGVSSRNVATETTRAVALSAMHAAEQLTASLIVVLTRSGKTALAVSELRSPIPILALTDRPYTARRLCIAWAVHCVVTDVCRSAPQQIMEFVVNWGQQQQVLDAGQHIVLVGTTDWNQPGKNVMLVHTVT